MRCCNQPAVLDGRCKEHFTLYFEQKVKDTIESHNLIPKDARVAVAVSGGKDSLTVLTLLKRWGYNVTAIAVDEGIVGYRDATLKDANRVCSKLEIPLIVKSYKELTGFTLDEMKPEHPCSVCGIFRRHLLNIAAKEFDVLATGHNADDESQAVLMNLIKGNTELFSRLGPAGSSIPGFTRRIKPLYFCTEKEVATYALLQGLLTDFKECPNVRLSYRSIIRDELNSYAQSNVGAKERILKRFLVAREAMRREQPVLNACEKCGEPSSKAICSACTQIALLQKV